MIFASGLGVPEGPVALPDGSWLVVEMAPERGCVTHIGQDGRTRRVVARTGRPNGLAMDKEGYVWVAETQTPALLRMSLDGQVETVLTSCGDTPFRFPNDLAFGPDGALYMTDSGIYLQDWARWRNEHPDQTADAPVDGRVYRVDVNTRAVRCLDAGLRFANGIAFGPDDRLYVSETLTGLVYRYRLVDGEVVGAREIFGNVTDPEAPAGHKGPDGMAFGADGNLYVAVFGQGDVTVLGADGSAMRRIKLDGQRPTNVAFGLNGETKIYVAETERGVLETHDVDTAGAALYG